MPAVTRSEIDDKLVTRTDARLELPLFLVRAPAVSAAMLIRFQGRVKKRIVAGGLADLKD